MVRHKNRYIVVQINITLHNNEYKDQPIEEITSYNLHTAIVKKVEQLHGDFGAAAIRAGFTAKYCNPHTRIAIIRVRHGPHVLVTSAIPLINVINKQLAVINTLYIGATIKQCLKFVLKYQQQKVDEHYMLTKNNDDDAKRTCLMDIESILQQF